MPPVSTTHFSRSDRLVDPQSGLGQETFLRFLESLSRLSIVINGIPGVNRWALAGQPSLGGADEGYLAYVTDYGHVVRWTGLVWEFASGDPGSGFFSVRPVAPQEPGWQLCDGTVTDYLTIGGATLTATAFTTPNPSDGTFLKKLAAYTGAIDAAIAPAVSGALANESAHTHDVTGVTGDNQDYVFVDNNADGSGINVATAAHSHTADGTLAAAAGTAHTHGLGTLAVSSASRPPSLGALLYFRR